MVINRSLWIVYSLVAVLLFVQTAQAQVCASATPIEASANNIDGVTGSGLISLPARMRMEGTLEFYLKPVASATPQYFYARTADSQYYGPIPPVGIRRNNAKWEFLSYDTNNEEIWTCGTRTGSVQDSGTGTIATQACPTATAGTWYRFKVTFQAYTRLATYEMAECDGPLTTYATDFGTYSRSLTGYKSGVGPHLEQWWIVNELHPDSFELANMQVTYDWDIEKGCYPDDDPDKSWKTTERLANYNGATFVACPSYAPNEWCANQDLTPVTGTSMSLDPENSFSTVTIGGCKGAITGPHTIVTAAHCFTAGFPLLYNETRDVGVVFGEYTKYEDVVMASTIGGVSTDYNIYRMVSPRIAGGYPNTGEDVIFAYTRDTLPGPYASLYDWEDPAHVSGCDYLVVHGLGQCKVDIRQEYTEADGITPSDQPVSVCIDNAEVGHIGGWSGGPLYAVGDWGSGTEARLIGPHTGGLIWTTYNNLLDPDFAAYTAANLDEPGYPLHEFEDGVQIWDVGLTTDSTDIGVSDITVTCETDIRSTGAPPAYAGCTVMEYTTREKQTCYSIQPETGSKYSCSLTLKQNHGNDWGLESVFTGTPDSPSRIRKWIDLYYDGLKHAHVAGLGITGSAAVPGVAAFASDPVFLDTPPSPGGTATCTAKVTAPNVASSTALVYAEGCLVDSATYTDSAPFCAEGRWTLDHYQGWYCDIQIPKDAPPGTDWTIKQTFMKDEIGRIAENEGSFDTITTFDCSFDTPDLSVVGDADGQWASPPTSPGMAAGYSSVIQLWARTSVTDANGVIAFGQVPVSDFADMKYGVRFAANGTLEYLEDGVWASPVPAVRYQANVWYKISLWMDATTSGGYVNPATYAVTTEACGERQKSLGEGITIGERLLHGIEHYNIYADDTQTIDVVHLSTYIMYCGVTSCLSEGWQCGEPPDGCGGIINYTDGFPFRCGECLPDQTCDTDIESPTAFMCQGGLSGAVSESYLNAKWTFTEGAELADTSPGGLHTLTSPNGGTWGDTTALPSRIAGNGAISFTGGSYYASASPVSSDGDLTVAFWVYAIPFQNSNSYILGNGDSWGIQAEVFGNYGLTVGGEHVPAATSIKVGYWIHFAAVLDSTANTVTYYINTVKETPQTLTNDATTGTDPFWIGKDSSNFSAFFSGVIDDVYIFNRVLSDAEIALLAYQ